MATEIPENKQCECCGQIREGGYRQFYYGRRLKANEEKELPTQIIQIGGSKSVYLCPRCLRKGLIEILVAIMLFALYLFLLFHPYGLDFGIALQTQGRLIDDSQLGRVSWHWL
jgi:hypothetical protein